MSKKIYIGTSSLSRKCTKLYVGVNGQARTIKAGYIGYGNVAKKFYPVSYRWARYSISYNTSYTPIIVSEDTIGFGRNCEFGQYSLIYTYTSGYNSGVNNYLYWLSRGDRYPNPDMIDDLSNGTVFYTFEHWIGTNSGNVSYIRADFGLNSQISNTRMVEFTKISGSYGGTLRRRIHGSTKQQTPTMGSYVDTVQSESRNAYPDNGVSGSYWYVFQGEV